MQEDLVQFFEKKVLEFIAHKCFLLTGDLTVNAQ